MSEPTPQQVMEELVASVGPDPARRSQATERIQNLMMNVDTNPGFARALLEIATSDPSESGKPPQLHAAMQASACVNFKNLVKKSWDPEIADHPLQDVEKDYVRGRIVELCLNAPINLFRVLEGALTIISECDFPHNWPQLLPQLVDKLRTCFDPNTNNVIPLNKMRDAERCLSACHAALCKYRGYAELTEDLLEEYGDVHKHLCKPVLSCLFAGVSGVAEAVHKQDEDGARASCGFLGQALEVVHDMISLDISDDYEESLPRFAEAYKSLLEISCGLIEQSNDSGSLADVKMKALAILSLHIQKYGEEIQPVVADLAHAAWNVLQPNSEDNVVIAVIQFLQEIARAPSLCQMLSSMLQPIIDRCIMPNIELDDFDVTTFEEDPIEYIEHDVEGTEQWTRRRAATELIRALLDGFMDQVGPIFTQALQEMLSAYYQNQQQNWKRKDGAMFLVTALAARGTASSQRGTVGNLTNLVNVADFYEKEIMTELQPNKNNNNNNNNNNNQSMGQLAAEKISTPQAILKSSAIRFVSTFRTHIPVSQYYNLLEMLSAWLMNDNVVVFSYAAHAIDRLLSGGTPTTPASSSSSSNSTSASGGADNNNRLSDLKIDQNLAGQLLQQLCIRLSKTIQPNEHLTKATANVLRMTSGDVLESFVGDVTVTLHEVMVETMKNPSNPQFTHFLFECFAWLIRRCPQFAREIEKTIWETLMKILIQNVLEMMPYSLQIVAQLLDTVNSDAETPEEYVQLLGPTLSQDFLAEKGNVPAVVRLVGSFLRQGGNVISQQQDPVSRMFQVTCSLIASKSTDHDGFMMLTGLMMHLSKDATNPFILDVLKVVLTRLQQSRTSKFERAGIIGCSSVVAKYGAATLAEMLEQLQQGLFVMFLRRFIFLNSPHVSSRIGRKCALMMLTNLADTLINSGEQDGPQLYCECVQSGVTIIMTMNNANNKSKQTQQRVTTRTSGGGGNNNNNNRSGGANNMMSSSSSGSSGGGLAGGGNIISSTSSSGMQIDFDVHYGAGAGQDLGMTASELRTSNLAETGFTNMFCPLQGTQRDPDDPFPDTNDPISAFVDAVSRHMKEKGQQVQGLLQQNISGELFSYLDFLVNNHHN